jgi:hypothetical protein
MNIYIYLFIYRFLYNKVLLRAELSGSTALPSAISHWNSLRYTHFLSFYASYYIIIIHAIFFLCIIFLESKFGSFNFILLCIYFCIYAVVSYWSLVCQQSSNFCLIFFFMNDMLLMLSDIIAFPIKVEMVSNSMHEICLLHVFYSWSYSLCQYLEIILMEQKLLFYNFHFWSC